MSDPQPTPAERERTASTVANYCLLTDPRNDGWLTRRGNDLASVVGLDSINDASERSCIRRQIDGKAALDDFSSPADGSQNYNLIVARARALAVVRNSQCLVREFNDREDEPNPYYGYRGADRQCHVTRYESVATDARRRHPQNPR